MRRAANPLERMRRAVFLDRDGVLNRSAIRDGRPFAPRALEEFELLPGVEEAIELLRRSGFLLIVVTNQPDINAGKIDPEVVQQMHEHLRERLRIDDIWMCPHLDADRCLCRKPRPGMLMDAAAKWSVDLSQSFMVGDRWRDVSAGKAAGCRTVFIDYGYAEAQRAAPDFVVKSLGEAANIIVRI